MVTKHSTTPLNVKKAIEKAEKADFHWLDHILLSVLYDKNINETLTTLDNYGWGYVIYLYEYKCMHESVKSAWEAHTESESKKTK